MNKFKLLFYILIFFSATLVLKAESIKIIFKIKNEIITNIDIKNERKYLLFLNPKLNSLKNSEVDEIVKNSLINEIIKKNELENYYDFNEN